jgi:hypothetical protein
VVTGEKLKVPFSTVAYHVLGAMTPLTSKAMVFRPGRMPASCRSWIP